MSFTTLASALPSPGFCDSVLTDADGGDALSYASEEIGEIVSNASHSHESESVDALSLCSEQAGDDLKMDIFGCLDDGITWQEMTLTVEVISVPVRRVGPPTLLACSRPDPPLEDNHDYMITVRSRETGLQDYKRATVLGTRSLSTEVAEIVVFIHGGCKSGRCSGLVCFVQLPRASLGDSLTVGSAYHAFQNRLPEPATLDHHRKEPLPLPRPAMRSWHIWPCVEALQEVSLRQDFQSSREDQPSAWHVTSLLKKIVVGQYAHFDLDGSVTFTGKFLKIRAVERGWAELHVQLWPKNVTPAARDIQDFIHVRVPLTEVDLPLRFIFWYTFHSSGLIDILSRVEDYDRPRSVSWNLITRFLLRP